MIGSSYYTEYKFLLKVLSDFLHVPSSSSDSYSFLTAASQLPNNDNDIQKLLEKAVKCDSYR